MKRNYEHTHAITQMQMVHRLSHTATHAITQMQMVHRLSPTATHAITQMQMVRTASHLSSHTQWRTPHGHPHSHGQTHADSTHSRVFVHTAKHAAPEAWCVVGVHAWSWMLQALFTMGSDFGGGHVVGGGVCGVCVCCLYLEAGAESL